jgi:hypothetical protein
MAQMDTTKAAAPEPQAAVTLATIAIATRERSTLWTLAAVIGVVAVIYAGYVYLFT